MALTSPPLRQLLRINSALSTALADGGPAAGRASERAKEDLAELLQQSGLPPDARKQLDQATAELGSAPISALQHLSQAAVALSAAYRSPFPRLPPELLRLILDFSLPTAPHFHQRQQTLITLASVSHQFHQVIRPTLLAEIHLTRASQLRGLDKLRKSAPERSKQVKLVTLHLDLAELRYVDDASWLGCFAKGVVEWLAGSERLWVQLEALELLVSDERMDTAGQMRVFGQGWDLPGLLERREGVVEAHLHLAADSAWADACRYYAMVTPGPQLRRLFVPSTKPTTEIALFLQQTFHETAEYTTHPWEILAAPQAAFFIPLLRNILPVPSASTLQRLEITLILPRIDPLPHRLEDIRALFTDLAAASSLRHLALRIRHSAWQDRQAVSLAFEEGIARLTHLRTLAIGGTGLSRTLSAAAFRRSSIRSLTLLPLARRSEPGVPPNALHDHINGNRGILRVLKVSKWLPKLTELEVHRGEGQPPSAALREACEQRGITLKMPEAGTDWIFTGN